MEMFFLGTHSSLLPTVAPPQLPSLLRCTAGSLISTALFLPCGKPQEVLCVLLSSFRAVCPIGQSRTLRKAPALSAKLLQLHPNLQWPEQERSCLLPLKQGAKQPKPSHCSHLRSRYIQLLYPSANARCCFIHVQLHDTAASSSQFEHHGSEHLIADAISRLVLFLLSLVADIYPS